MDFEGMKKVNEKFANESKFFYKDFIELWEKWYKKSPRLSIVNTLHLPINLIMNMLDAGLPLVFPALPNMMERFLMPFILLKDVWGKIPPEKFREKYDLLYESQWDKVGFNEEEREAFKKWYEANCKEKNT